MTTLLIVGGLLGYCYWLYRVACPRTPREHLTRAQVRAIAADIDLTADDEAALERLHVAVMAEVEAYLQEQTP